MYIVGIKVNYYLLSYFVILYFLFFLITSSINTSVMFLIARNEVAAQKADPFLTYENPIYGIRILYPVNWEKKEDHGLAKQIIVKFGPAGEKYPAFFVEVGNTGNRSVSLENYTNEQVNRLKQLFPDLNISESTSTTLAGNHAYKLVYTFALQHIDIKKMEIWMIRDSKIYSINYVVENENYENHLPAGTKR